MMMSLTPQTTLMSISKATEDVASMNAEGDDWTYKIRVVNEDRELAAIECYDEDGEFVADM